MYDATVLPLPKSMGFGSFGTRLLSMSPIADEPQAEDLGFTGVTPSVRHDALKALLEPAAPPAQHHGLDTVVAGTLGREVETMSVAAVAVQDDRILDLPCEESPRT